MAILRRELGYVANEIEKRFKPYREIIILHAESRKLLLGFSHETATSGTL